MTDPVLVEWRRADLVERAHRGRVAIVGPDGGLVTAIGDVAAPMLPRSSCKIVQAIPMVESGAADAFHLTTRHLAFACASHQGSHDHARLAETWLAEMAFGEENLMCGPQTPADEPTCADFVKSAEAPSQLHNNCSGKHTGFLAQAKHLGVPSEGYIYHTHQVQMRVAEATEALAGEPLANGFAIDGCSAPNYALSLTGLAKQMASIANAETVLSGKRRDAAIRLRDAMAAHPFEVAGTGRCCTELMQAGKGAFTVKTGAEGCFTAILPGLGYGVALKIDDGATEAANMAMAAILVRLGALSADDPAIQKWLQPKIRNRRNIICGEAGPTETLTALTLA